MMSYASSSSSTTLAQGYDVFLSFRGEDTRTGFISHLYDALTRKHIRTYKDDRSLEIGNFIAPGLLEAIEVSKVAIVVLSSNFATSKWCLEEIAKIVDCMERGKLIVVPVFYHVPPSDVRHQSGCFIQGFSDHEANIEIEQQKVITWKAAFATVGRIKGLDITQHRNESEVVTEILTFLKSKLDTVSTSLDDGLVGIESRVDEVKRMLSMESDDVRFIGICGMSGVGKTALAEAVYGAIRKEFQKSSYIQNIKDISKDNDSTGLCNLQQKLLKDILDESIHVQDVTSGKDLLGTKLRDLKIIILLDDVNHVDQLTNLAGRIEWFGSGTRVIVTTSNKHVLSQHKMQQKKPEGERLLPERPLAIYEIYTCEELKSDEALQLFCKSAFGGKKPAHGYEKLSHDIVKLAGGLPLAIRAYGSLLCEREKSYWEEMFRKLQEYPHEQVLGRLKIVYDRLDRDQQNAFIHVACFLKGRNKDLVKDILSNIGLFSECGVPDLIDNFLLTINHDDSVWTHDLLQQMCWESQRYDEKHIAIKYRHDIVDILSSKQKGMATIEIINQEADKVEVDDCFTDPMCFANMVKLKFIRITNMHFPKGLKYISNDIRILEWNGCTLKTWPSQFEPIHIYELEMCYSHLETLWEKKLDLPNLRSINLSFSKDLIKIPDLTATPNLAKLNLEGCTKLTKLHKSVLLHKRIEYMNLKGCTHLRTLGRDTMEMEALEALLLSGCTKLGYIPEFGVKMKRLEHLYVDGTRIVELPENLRQMCDLRKLDASGTSIQELPSFIHHLKRLRLVSVRRCPLSSKIGGFLQTNMDTLSSGLRELDLSYCELSAVPDGIGLLYHLVNLDLSGNYFLSLPPSISLLSNLTMLCLNNCKRLRSLPKLSIANMEMDYGPRTRFSYYISQEEVDVFKFNATSNNASPMVSCLNCPKLAENGRPGSNLVKKVLNSYLELRTKYWMTPEAVFEIVGAGSEIPSDFVQPGSDDLILEGPWAGVAICAVIASHHIDAYIKANYVVTAHIHLGEKRSKIPLRINLLAAKSENQLLFYWTVANDLQRVVGSSQKNIFNVSFSVEPEDGNLHVTKFGVCFIHKKYMLQLKRHDYITNLIGSMFMNHASDSSSSIIHHHTREIVDAIFNDGEQEASLDSCHKIIKCLLEINQEFFSVLSVGKKDWKYALYIQYSYYEISLQISILCSVFVRSLKDINDGWLSVKLALDQIVVRKRSDDYTYEEMLQQLNDLEAADCLAFSDNLIEMLASILDQAYITYFYMSAKKNFKKAKVLEKISSITIACVFCMVATYIGDFKFSKAMQDVISIPMWVSLFQSSFKKDAKRFYEIELHRKTSYDYGLQISVLNDNATLLQELMNKMARSRCFTKQNEEEMMMIVIDKLEKNINKLSNAIEDINTLANIYKDDTRKAKKHFTSYPITTWKTFNET